MAFVPHLRAPRSRDGLRLAALQRLGWGCAVALSLHLPAAAASKASGLRGSVGSRAPGYLGIEFHDVPSEQSKALHLPANQSGVEVVMVDHDGPAGKAGLRAHDIIVSLNGQALAGAEALRKMLREAGSGVQVALTVLRSGHPINLTAQLATRDEVARSAMAHLAAAQNDAPSDPPDLAVAALPADLKPTPDAVNIPVAPATPPPGSGFLGHIVHGGIYTGAVLDAMEPQLAGFFGAPQGVGLLVHSVLPGSPAANAGLKAGDVVTRADLYTLRNTNDWAKRLHAAKGRPIMLSVLRDRRELTLTLQQDLKHHSMLEMPTLW